MDFSVGSHETLTELATERAWEDPAKDKPFTDAFAGCDLTNFTLSSNSWCRSKVQHRSALADGQTGSLNECRALELAASGDSGDRPAVGRQRAMAQTLEVRL